MPKPKVTNRIAKDEVQEEVLLNGEMEDGGPDDAPETDNRLVKIEIMSFTVEGVSPLLQNNPAEFIGKEEGGVAMAKKTYNDEEETSKRLYRTPDGDFYIPSESFLKAMVRAASGLKVKKEFATNLLKGNVFAAEPYCVIEDLKGKPARDYGIDRRSVVIGKSRVLRCRPCWMKWRVQVVLEVNSYIFSRDAVKQFLEKAGRFPGVGDYRPESGGAFGRFRVVG